MAKRNKRKVKTRAKIHVSRVKAGRRSRIRARAVNNVSRSRRRAAAASRRRSK